jgi:hypothetical protein
MAENAIEVRQQAFMELLVRRIGAPPDATGVSAATIGIWTQVTEQLAPVIGLRGVRSLLCRSVHITAKRIPWLAVAGEPESCEALLSHLRARLEECEAVKGTEASRDLLITFHSLLAGLIGEQLTDQLMYPILIAPSENKQEIAP